MRVRERSLGNTEIEELLSELWREEHGLDQAVEIARCSEIVKASRGCEWLKRLRQ